MAQRTTVVLVDDIDGTEGDDVRTVRFQLEGVMLELELSAHNRERMSAALAPYVDAARRVPARARRRAKGSSS